VFGAGAAGQQVVLDQLEWPSVTTDGSSAK
jgi:hypothetical protein